MLKDSQGSYDCRGGHRCRMCREKVDRCGRERKHHSIWANEMTGGTELTWRTKGVASEWKEKLLLNKYKYQYAF